ncbi:MAG: arginine--tRNA ligase [Gammaproteobacteria bacterium]
MKDTIHALLTQAVAQAQANGLVPADAVVQIQLERTKDPIHGDFASNLAMTLTKQCKKPPMDIANALVAALPHSPHISKVVVAPPGFINFFVTADSATHVVPTILAQQNRFGENTMGNNTRIFLEYVSSNPTGPLHVGHGRGAAFGASLALLLKATGYDVHSEYYVNDAGRQMDILATSLWLRYLESQGVKFSFPSNGYKGDYLKAMVPELIATFGNKLMHPADAIFKDVPKDADPENPDAGGDKEEHIDALIVHAKTLLGTEYYSAVFNLALNTVLSDIRQDLKEFGVVFDEWFSEKFLMTSGAIQHTFDVLQKHGHLYEQDGGLWFRSTTFGDDKDRCVSRANGQTTYFASDIAYMLNKFERGAQKLIYIFGSDHHGYVPRLRACIEALGHKNDDVTFELVQFAVLYRGEERVQMSTRSGSFVTLRELRDEVGNDAARFFYVMRKADHHMDFDLELAKSQSNENPVYYIQYAHARICAVFKQLSEKGYTHDIQNGLAHLSLLNTPHEEALLRELNRYPELIRQASEALEPHRIALYLRELAHALHSYYNAHVFLDENPALRDARLCLIMATRQILKNGLTLLGVSAPEAM